MHSKTACKLVLSTSRDFAATPKSSTYCAHWSALVTGSKYSQIKFEMADIALLRSWASLRYANVLLAKLNESTSTDLWSATCKQRYAWEQSSLQDEFFPAMCCAASDIVLTG